MFGAMLLAQTLQAVNYATWNPSDKSTSVTLSDGNLTVGATNYGKMVRATVGKSSGKWYWECTDIGGASGCGVATATSALDATYPDANGWAFYCGGGNFHAGGSTAYGGTGWNYATSGYALDMDAGTLTCYVGGVSKGVMVSGLTGVIYPFFRVGGNHSAEGRANFGSSAFVYSVPSGFNAGLYP